MNKLSIPAISLALSLAMSGAQAGDSTFVITSGKNNYLKTGTYTESNGNANITVNENQKHQKWRGLGGTFNEAGWMLSMCSVKVRETGPLSYCLM